MLILYLKQTFHFDNTKAFVLLGSFYTLFFMMPLVGGWLIDKFGKLEAITCGTIFAFIGVCFTAFSQYHLLIFGLALLAIGAALVMPAYYCVLGDTYRKNDPRRESGFTFMYMIMNIGFSVSLMIGAFTARYIGYSLTNLACAAVVLLSIIIYIPIHKKITAQNPSPTNNQGFSKKHFLILFSCSLLLTFFSLAILLYSTLNYYFVSLIFLGAVFGGVCIYFKQHDKTVKSKIILFYALCLLSLFFWVFYFLEPTLLTVFSNTLINLHYLGVTFPAEFIFSLDSTFVVLTGLILTQVWVKLEAKNKNPSLPTKFTIAPFLVAIGYLVLVVEVYFNRSGLMNLSWMILAYFFFTLGELFLAPIGFSMAGKLAPKDREGFFMGVWQMSIGGAATISSVLASAVIVSKAGPISQQNTGYLHAFILFAGIGLIMFIIAFIFLPWMKRLIK